MNSSAIKWISRVALSVSAICFLIVIIARLFLGGWIDFLWWPLSLFVVGLFTHFIVDVRMYWNFFTSKTAQSGMNFGTSLLTVLVILSCIGYLSVLNDVSFDLTEEKLHSLSPQTISLLNSKEDGLKITIIYNGASAVANKNSIRKAFSIYKEAAPQMKMEFINAQVQNKKTKEYLGSTQLPKDAGVYVFVNYQSKKAYIENPMDENSVLKSLTQVSARVQKQIYFTSGHGERDFNSQGRTGLFFLRQFLEDSSFNISEWNFIEKKSGVPEDAAALLIIGPTKPFFEQEIKWIKDYISKKGRIFVALDPGAKHNLAPLLRTNLGIQFKNNILRSSMSRLVGKGPSSIFGLGYHPKHPVTQLFSNANLGSSIFDEVSEVVISESASPQWKTFNLVRSIPVSISSNQPRNAAVAVAVQEESGEEDKKESGFAAIVFGDSDFLTNSSLGIGIHKDLALNSISFLADETNLVSLRPKKPKGTQVILTRTAQYLFIISSILIPLICFILAGTSWWIRKRS